MAQMAKMLILFDERIFFVFFFAVGCKVDDWSFWSDCSATCGGGTKTRVRGHVREAENGGDPCLYSEKESCNTEQCKGSIPLLK